VLELSIKNSIDDTQKNPSILRVGVAQVGVRKKNLFQNLFLNNNNNIKIKMKMKLIIS
jgi:hypothetical protein